MLNFLMRYGSAVSVGILSYVFATKATAPWQIVAGCLLISVISFAAGWWRGYDSGAEAVSEGIKEACKDHLEAISKYSEGSQ